MMKLSKQLMQWLSAMAVIPISTMANEITIGDPGSGVFVLAMEQVPDALGIPWEEDPPLFVSSEVPVQVLRYSDYPQFFLEGGQPLYSHQVYVVVKSDCGDDATLIPQIEYTTTNRANEWDQSKYTTAIDITFPSVAGDVIDTENFLEASVFNATFAYGSHWCLGQKYTDTETPTSVPKETHAPSSLQQSKELDNELPTNPQSPPESTQVKDDADATDSAQPSNNNPVTITSPAGSGGTSSKTLVSFMVVLLLSVFLVVGLGAGDHRSGKTNFLITMVVVMIAMLMATSTITSAEPPIINGKTTAATTAATQQSPRKLQQCAVTVEILIDGCRRVQAGSDLPDLEVVAPAVRVMDGEVRDMVSWKNSADPCVTDYTANLAFNVTPSGADDTLKRQDPPVVSVGSFSPELPQYGSCFRAVEGRPYVDSDGRHVHAKAVQQSTAVWSATAVGDSTGIVEKDEALGQQWLDRAVGEHASVPAFAAFTIALMSNNAPPGLVQDALTAAQDEVRHAKISFEVASLLMGKTMEPGPLPPSSLTFGQDIKALAVAAAKEGCVDETLSALVAGLEVDHQIDQNPNISEDTKAVLRDKMRTIALEETNHSGLAWRTVRWACSVDEDACNAVQTEVFHNDYFERAFAQRFAHLEGHNIVLMAKRVWDDIRITLIPIALGGTTTGPEVHVSGSVVDVPSVLCLGEAGYEQTNSVLQEIGQRIMSQLTCSLYENLI